MKTEKEYFKDVMGFLVAVGLTKSEDPTEEDLKYAANLVEDVPDDSGDEMTNTIMATIQSLVKMGHLEVQED